MNESSLRSERLERAIIEDLHASASPALREELGLSLLEVGTTLVSMARHDPSILLNRAIGLGIETSAARGEVEEIVARYREAGVGRFYLHLHPEAGPAELATWVREAGLVPGRAWAKFYRRDDPPPPGRPGLEARLATPEDAGIFGRIAAAGFGMKEASARLVAGLVGRPGWHIFLSHEGEEVAGCAALHVREGVAWFDWASTLPAFRRRGSQGTLLRRRIRAALELGCDLMVTATGVAAPGDPQHSYRNIERVGFRVGVVRENFVPEGS